MATGILVGVADEDTLLAIRDAAIESFSSGGRMETSLQHGSGNGVTRAQAWGPIEGMTAADVLREAKYALWKLEPTKYTAYAPGFRKSYARIVH